MLLIARFRCNEVAYQYFIRVVISDKSHLYRLLLDQ